MKEETQFTLVWAEEELNISDGRVQGRARPQPWKSTSISELRFPLGSTAFPGLPATSLWASVPCFATEGKKTDFPSISSKHLRVDTRPRTHDPLWSPGLGSPAHSMWSEKGKGWFPMEQQAALEEGSVNMSSQEHGSPPR